MELRSSFQQMLLEQLDIHMQNMTLDTDFTLFIKWITDLNVKCKITKLLESNIGENLGDLAYLQHQRHKGTIHGENN